MLLYVDKKKEKQKKIRRCLLVLFCIFFLSINIFQFRQSLQYSKQSLVTYVSIKHLASWFRQADVVYLLKSVTGGHNAVIIVPHHLNRENVLTIASALSKLQQRQYKVFVSHKIENVKIIKGLVSLFYPQVVFVDKIEAANLLISTEFQEVKSYIFSQHLYPMVLNFKHTNRIQQNGRLMRFIDEHFVSVQQPQSELEKEAFALQQFIDDYGDDLRRFVFNHTEPQFASQNFFLQNIRVCLQSKDENIVCSLSEDVSLKENLHKLLKEVPSEIDWNRFYLLTSDEEISSSKFLSLEQDEGVYFYYQGLDAFLLPEDIKKLDNIAQVFYLLKEKAGLNPLFEAPDMKFYKFKIREVTIDEEI